MSNQMMTQEQRPKFSVMISTPAWQKTINNTLRDPDRAKRFVAAITSAVATNPALQECDPPTILSSALLGESLNLSPSPQLGQYYMVPFENRKKGCKDAQFVLGYKGYIQLALRSGQYKHLNVIAVKEGELVRWDPLTEDYCMNVISDESAREKAKTTGYLAMFEYLNGFRKTIYWSKEKMVLHADRYSPAFSASAQDIRGKNGSVRHKVSFADYEAGNYPKNDEWMYSSFWYKDFDGMAFKTMLRQLISKWGIMSVDLQKAFEAESAYEEEAAAPFEAAESAALPEVPYEEPAPEPAQEEAPTEPDQQEGEEETVDLNDI